MTAMASALRRAGVSRKAVPRSTAPLDADELAVMLAAALPEDRPAPALYLFGDGGCQYLRDPSTGKKRKTGPGGWGAVLLLIEPQEEPLALFLSGADKDTTNNRMELYALIRGLTAVNDLPELVAGEVPVHAITDSQYAVKGITEWLAGWLKRKWDGVKNVTYWKLLLVARGDLPVTWHHCRGHRDPSVFPAKSWDRFTALGNDAADRLATQARDAANTG